MIIRPYQPRDHETVIQLHRQALEAAGGYIEGPWDRDFDDIEGTYTDPGGVFLVGEVDGRIVAMGALLRTGPGDAEIKRMRVHLGHQGKGHGAAMLQRLEAMASERGVHRLSLDTGIEQTAAQRLYERSGYRRTGRTTLGIFDQLLYEKHLPAAEDC